MGVFPITMKMTTLIHIEGIPEFFVKGPMKTKLPKHPNRVKNPQKVVDAEDRMFDHLRKGQLYKMSLEPSVWDQTLAKLYRNPAIEEPINGSLETGKTIIYLGRERSGHGLFHKIVYGDQVGWVKTSHGLRFKRYTKRMLSRMEESSNNHEDEGEQDPG